MRDPAEFWEELLAQIEAGQVIPVIGPELSTVTIDGREASLYRLLAERLPADLIENRIPEALAERIESGASHGERGEPRLAQPDGAALCDRDAQGAVAALGRPDRGED